MRTLAAVTLTLGLVALGFADEAGKKAALDPAKLLGEWTYESGVRGGDMVDKARLVGKVEITKDTITLGAGTEQKFVMPYKLDVKKSPVEVDLEIKEGPVGQGSKAAGILSLDGDELKICYTPLIEEGAKRPAKLESTKDNKAFLFTLKRVKK